MEALAGLLIGIAVGLTGVGGGILTTPVLILLFGVTPEAAVGTALLFNAAVKLSAVAAYLWRRQVDGGVLFRLLAGGLPGALAGPLLFARAGSQGWVLAVVGAVVALSAGVSLFRPAPAERAARLDARLPFFAFPIGLGVGFSSAGAGALGSVLLARCTTLAATSIVGTDLAFGLAVSAVAGGIHFGSGHLDGTLLLRLLLGGMLGASLGAWAATLVPTKILRAAILSSASLLGVAMMVKGLAG